MRFTCSALSKRVAVNVGNGVCSVVDITDLPRICHVGSLSHFHVLFKIGS